MAATATTSAPRPGGIASRHPYTWVALAIACVVSVAAVFWHVNLFELPAASLIGVEQTEGGEIVMAFLLVIPAFFVDHVITRQRGHEAQLHAERLRVLQVTMRTVQDIVNNNLNQLQLLRLEAEGHVSDATLAQFDATIQDMAARLTVLGNMPAFSETPTLAGAGLAWPDGSVVMDVHGR